MYYTNHLTSIPTILTSIKLNDKGLGAESGHACGADVRPRQPTRRRAVHGPVTVLSLLLALNLADLLRIRVRCGHQVARDRGKRAQASYMLCHIIIHTMSHHHTSSYILCHIIIHTMSHHHQVARDRGKRAQAQTQIERPREGRYRDRYEGTGAERESNRESQAVL
jgi:hypothetical protein